jgi:hypothetical protein
MSEKPTISSPKRRLRRLEAARRLNDVHGIPMTPKTLANRNAAGLEPRPEYLGTIPFYSEDKLDAWAATAFTSESPVAATRRRHAELERARREQEVGQPATEHRQRNLGSPPSAA